MNVVLVAGGEFAGVSQILARFRSSSEETCYVGVDFGAIVLLQEGLPLHLAVGDFDSLSKKQVLEVKEKAERVIQVLAEKEDTDLQLALQEMVALYPQAQYFLVGASGGRIDHFLTTLFLPLEERFSLSAPRIHLLDEGNHVDFYLPGTYELQKLAGMRYWGVVALTSVSEFEIRGMKYELSPTDTQGVRIYPSNEFVGETAIFRFTKGMVATIQSKDTQTGRCHG